MGKIKNVHAREILDSRGNPTIEVEVYLESGLSARAAVPSGASTGKYESLELRDRDKKRYFGKGVLNAIDNVNKIIAPKIKGLNCVNQTLIDKVMIELDGTENKSKLGANSILGVSLAVCRAASEYLGVPLYQHIGGCNAKVLPVPCLNVLNGGKHADNNVDLQEFMIVPAGASSFHQALRFASETYHSLGGILKESGLSTSVGDEGGFAPMLKSNEEAIQFIIKAIEKAKYLPGEDIYIGIDAAASSFFKEGAYILEGENKKFNSEEMINYYEKLVHKYPIVFIEDGLSEDDWEGWRVLTDRLSDKIQIIGDDLFVTNPKRLQRGIELKIANSILIKLNQIGTVTETLDTVEIAKRAGYSYMFSHRSGETEDSFLADVTVATNATQIKTGATARSERLSKYNQLLRIEELLGSNGIYTGKAAFKNIK